MRMRRTALLTAAAIGAGAGGPALASVARTTVSAATIRATCSRPARRAIAEQVGVRPVSMRMRFSMGNNGMPQCTFSGARARSGGPSTRVSVTVNVDDGPQAFWRLMRTLVEAQQEWGGINPSAKKVPIGLVGLGPYASWYPELDALIAGNLDRKHLLTVTIGWPHAKRWEKIRLARATITPYRRTR
jgi:hypothetical protein